MAEDGKTRATAWLEAWDGQGLHRTATAGDEAGADWLMREAESARRRRPPSKNSRSTGSIRSRRCLEIGGRGGSPACRCSMRRRPTPPGSPAGSGRSAATPRSPSPSCRRAVVYSGEFRTLRRGKGHDGARGPLPPASGPGLGLLNAEQFREPYGAPAIHVASEARERVLAAAAGGASARLVAHSRRTPARGRNVVATLPGRDPSPAAGRGHDAAQLVVAIDRRARRRARLLARNPARAPRRAARLRRRLHRQQRPRARPSRARRFHRPPPRLGPPVRRRRCALGALRRQYRRRRRRAVGPGLERGPRRPRRRRRWPAPAGRPRR